MKLTLGQVSFKALLYLFFTVVALLCLYPFWVVLVTSISPYDVYLKNPLRIIPAGFTVNAYKMIFSQENVIDALIVSVVITAAGTVLSLAATIPTAYVLSRKYLKGRRVFLFLFFFTALFEGGLIPLYFVVRALKMVNTVWSLMIPLLINTFYMLIMRSFFLSFPESLEESAKMEGCSDIRILIRIVIPLSKAVIAVIGLFYAIERWNDFFYALMFINRSTLQPLQLLVYNLISPGSGISFAQINEISLQSQGVILETIKSAAVMLSVVPIVFIYPFIQKYFTTGLMLGSLKE